jgi:hypothetical protein
MVRHSRTRSFRERPRQRLPRDKVVPKTPPWSVPLPSRIQLILFADGFRALWGRSLGSGHGGVHPHPGCDGPGARIVMFCGSGRRWKDGNLKLCPRGTRLALGESAQVRIPHRCARCDGCEHLPRRGQAVAKAYLGDHARLVESNTSCRCTRHPRLFPPIRHLLRRSAAEPAGERMPSDDRLAAERTPRCRLRACRVRCVPAVAPALW